jgi:signal transduction histidine kinase
MAAAVALFTLAAAMIDPAERTPRTAVTAIVALVTGGALIWRRTRPLFAALIVVAASAIDCALGGQINDNSATLVPVLVLGYSVGRYSTGRWLVAGLLVLGLGPSLSEVVLGDTADGVVNIVAFDLLVAAGLPVLLGVVVRRRALLIAELHDQRAELERQRDARVRDAAADERVRIASELHDVVVHDVSAMVVQAVAARELVRTQPDDAAEAIARVEGAGRQALDELRRALGVLRSSDRALALHPQPTLMRLPELVERLRAGGAVIDLAVEPAAAGVPAGVQLAVYRIVQELLAGAAAGAAVSVRRGDGAVFVEVHRNGDGPQAEALAAARTRAGLFDGLLESFDEPGGGWRVCARLPLPA